MIDEPILYKSIYIKMLLEALELSNTLFTHIENNDLYTEDFNYYVLIIMK